MCIPGEYEPLLEWVPVDDVVESVRADAVVIEQRVAPSRRAVADDPLPVLLQLGEDRQQLAPGCARPGRGKRRMWPRRTAPAGPSSSSHSSTTDVGIAPFVARRAKTLIEPPWMSSRSNVEDLEPEQAEVVYERLHRVLGDMLVVDAVELVLLDELERMRHLDDEDAVVVEQERHAQSKRVEIADVVECVRRDDDLCRAMLLADLSGQVGCEVFGDDLQTFLARELGDIPSGVDTERSSSSGSSWGTVRTSGGWTSTQASTPSPW